MDNENMKQLKELSKRIQKVIANHYGEILTDLDEMGVDVDGVELSISVSSDEDGFEITVS